MVTLEVFKCVGEVEAIVGRDINEQIALEELADELRPIIPLSSQHFHLGGGQFLHRHLSLFTDISAGRDRVGRELQFVYQRRVEAGRLEQLQQFQPLHVLDAGECFRRFACIPAIAAIVLLHVFGRSFVAGHPERAQIELQLDFRFLLTNKPEWILHQHRQILI